MSEPLIRIPGPACDARVFFHQIVALSLWRGDSGAAEGRVVAEMSQALPAQAPRTSLWRGGALAGLSRSM